MQDATTADMIFGVAEILASCSANFTLEPGDLLITGTPWGVGVFREPPVFLRPATSSRPGSTASGRCATRSSTPRS